MSHVEFVLIGGVILQLHGWVPEGGLVVHHPTDQPLLIAAAFAAMARRIDSHASEAPGLAELVDHGAVTPPISRLPDVLAEHPPLNLDDAQATSRALDEQRSERA